MLINIATKSQTFSALTRSHFILNDVTISILLKSKVTISIKHTLFHLINSLRMRVFVTYACIIFSFQFSILFPNCNWTLSHWCKLRKWFTIYVDTLPIPAYRTFKRPQHQPTSTWKRKKQMRIDVLNFATITPSRPRKTIASIDLFLLIFVLNFKF